MSLYYLRARYYNPLTGRFLSVDSQASEGQRRYEYAAADPVNGMDPTGNNDIIEFELLNFQPSPIMSWPKFCWVSGTNPMGAFLPGCGGGSGGDGGGGGGGPHGRGGDPPGPPPGPPPPPCSPPKTLSAQEVDPFGSYFWVKADWLLSSPSCQGGYVVQHVVADWPKADTGIAGHWNYWEAWKISKGSTQTAYHNKFGFDDRFSGSHGTKLNAEARFYEGLSLPNTFVRFSVKPAHDLPATLTDPHLSTANATPPVVREFNP